MTLNVMLDKGAKMPTRSYKRDMGLDLYCKEGENRYSVEIPPRGSYIFDTGVHVEIPYGYGGYIDPRSGLLTKDDIFTAGDIDSGYTVSIRVKLFNLSPNKPYIVCPGDKIAQLVIVHLGMPELVLVDHFAKTERSDNGFGSTGVR